MPTHQYAFAHIVLPAFARSQPAEFFAAMSSVHRDQVLGLLWHETESQAGPPATAFDASSIRASCGSIDGMPAVVLELPSPEGLAEAFFVAVVSLNGLPSRDASEKADLRYITLELGKNMDDSPRTVLCEWRYGIHFNYGDGPEPTLLDFYGALRELLSQSAPQRPASQHADV